MKVLYTLAILLLGAGMTFADAGAPKEKAAKPVRVQAIGTLTVKFNADNPAKIESARFASEGEDAATYEIDVKKSNKRIAKYNGKKVKIRGKALEENLIISSVSLFREKKVKAPEEDAPPAE